MHRHRARRRPGPPHGRRRQGAGAVRGAPMVAHVIARLAPQVGRARRQRQPERRARTRRSATRRARRGRRLRGSARRPACGLARRDDALVGDGALRFAVPAARPRRAARRGARASDATARGREDRSTSRIRCSRWCARDVLRQPRRRSSRGGGRKIDAWYAALARRRGRVRRRGRRVPQHQHARRARGGGRPRRTATPCRDRARRVARRPLPRRGLGAGATTTCSLIRFARPRRVILFHCYALTGRWTDEPLWRRSRRAQPRHPGRQDFFCPVRIPGHAELARAPRGACRSRCRASCASTRRSSPPRVFTILVAGASSPLTWADVPGASRRRWRLLRGATAHGIRRGRTACRARFRPIRSRTRRTARCGRCRSSCGSTSRSALAGIVGPARAPRAHGSPRHSCSSRPLLVVARRGPARPNDAGTRLARCCSCWARSRASGAPRSAVAAGRGARARVAVHRRQRHRARRAAVRAAAHLRRARRRLPPGAAAGRGSRARRRLLVRPVRLRVPDPADVVRFAARHRAAAPVRDGARRRRSPWRRSRGTRSSSRRCD